MYIKADGVVQRSHGPCDRVGFEPHSNNKGCL
jgi:hypothetical protein